MRTTYYVPLSLQFLKMDEEIFSPILAITQYGAEEYFDGSLVFVCFTLVEDLLPCLFFIGSIVVFFLLPLAILIFIYVLIANTLMHHPTVLATSCRHTSSSQNAVKYRKQVILMLGAVVMAFFLCLLPFRALTLWIIVAPAGSNFEIGFETYYNILFFSRIMFHINSAINPILYNIISSKFRGGFLRLVGVKLAGNKYKTASEVTRKSTNSSTHTSSQQTSESFLYQNKRHNSKPTNCPTKGEEIDDTKQRQTDCYYKIAKGLKLPSEEIFV